MLLNLLISKNVHQNIEYKERLYKNVHHKIEYKEHLYTNVLYELEYKERYKRFAISTTQ